MDHNTACWVAYIDKFYSIRSFDNLPDTNIQLALEYESEYSW